jgi:acyl-CoA reductase-like NAD-dependent aldehyde dehydrogenase
MLPQTITSTNPAKNFDVIGVVPMSSPDEIHAKVLSARKAFPAWRDMGVQKRLTILAKLRDQFITNKQKLAELMTMEMGMPMTQTLFTVDRAVLYMNWSLENAERVLTPEVTYEDANEIHEILFEPYGVAACISPWNFPASNFVWACFQALCTGNTVVFKNSEEVQLFGQEIEKMARDSGFPEGVFNVIYGDGAAAQAMIADDINIISFTGSTRVGEILYKQAAEKFIPLVLELGGSDPGLIFADADMNKVIPSIYAGRFTNCGQVCQSMTRVIVHDNRFDEVVTKLSSLLSTKKCGDPMKMDTDIGPLVSQKQLDTLVGQVQDAIDKGAKIICGGKRPDGLIGAYFEPTILTNITPDMRVWREEVFGPVLPIVSFKDEDEGFAKANDTIYGLSSNVFSEDKDLISRAISKLQAGTVRVNGVNAGRPCNIFGGYKRSGLGRENGAYGLHDMTQKKMVSRNK